MARLVTAVRFEPESVIVEFDEVYPNGLIRKQVLVVPLDGGSDYLDEVMGVQTAVENLIDDALEDTALMKPLTLDELMEPPPSEDEDGISFG